MNFLALKGTRTHHLGLSDLGDTPNICFMQDFNDFALQHKKSGRHEQNQEKEKTQTTEFNIFISNYFSSENKKCSTQSLKIEI